MKTRLIYPDFIKGLAIILMVYGHINYIGQYQVIQLNIQKAIYSFHMPFFLIISGFFFVITSDGKLQISKLLKRIGIPYFFFCSTYLIGLIIGSKLKMNISSIPPLSLLSFFKTLFLFPIGAYWFLHSILLINLVFICANYFFLKVKKLYFYAILVLLFYLLDELNIVEIRTSFYFVLGYLGRRLTIRINKLPKYLYIVLLIICFLFFLQNKAQEFTLFEIINCVSLLGLFWGIYNKIKYSFFVSIVAWIGQNTLIILLVHAFFIVSLKMFKYNFLEIDTTGLLYSLFVTSVAVLISILSSRIFDLIRVSRIFFQTDFLYKKYKKITDVL